MKRLLESAKAILAVLLVLAGTRSGGVAAAGPTRPEKVDLLFVQNSRATAVDIEKHTLTLIGISPTTVFFSDRPVRLAGHYTTEEFLKLWDEGKDSFLADPPNATLSVFEKGKADLVDLVVKLKNPRLMGSDLIYDINVLEGRPSKAGGPASLFIDFFLMRRRMEARAVMYGAAVTSAAAAQSMDYGPPPQSEGTAPGGPPQSTEYGPPPQSGGTTPSEPPAAPSQKLSELKSLYDQGLISKSEYEAKKQEVLNQIVQ